MLKPLNINAEQTPVPSITEQGDAYTIGATRTATRLDLSPRETPQTTTTFTRRQLEDFKLNSANDALQAGGVNVQRVETDRTYFSVRGFDVSNFQLDVLACLSAPKNRWAISTPFFTTTSKC